MTTVHKFPVVRIGEPFVVETHADAQPLAMQYQGGQLVFWMRADTSTPVVRRRFLATGTGHSCPPASRAEYVGTAQDPATGFVWHLFAL